MPARARFSDPILTATVAILLCGAASGALAQAAEVAPSAQGPEVARNAAAEAEAAGDGSIDTLIVTARRRLETVQDVPLAVSVVGGERLDATGTFNLSRLQQLTPTLQFYASNPRNTTVNIRGLGVPFGLTSDGFEQGVGFYIDDVYNARVAAATLDFLDVARIEVLRGPQGTLYGKNTTAGAVNITTNQPTFDFEGYGEGVGRRPQVQAGQGRHIRSADGHAAARFAVSSTTRRGDDLQCDEPPVDQRTGQSRPPRPTALQAQRQPRRDPVGRLQRAEPGVLRPDLRAHRRHPKAAEPPVRGAGRRPGLHRRQHRSV